MSYNNIYVQIVRKSINPKQSINKKIYAILKMPIVFFVAYSICLSDFVFLGFF